MGILFRSKLHLQPIWFDKISEKIAKSFRGICDKEKQLVILIWRGKSLFVGMLLCRIVVELIIKLSLT